jgi:protein-L-isoaspartate(D-aspartate) O-methyltransferase
MLSSEEARSYYARLIAGRGGTSDERLVAAFERVPRERFVGPGPWKVFAFAGGYIETPSDDLAFLYQDILVALVAERRIHNGEPSLHARCLAALQPRPGEAAIHVGAGTGYYTAIMAHLVGPAGSVAAYEIDEGLAAQATINLADLANVVVSHRSGSEGHFPQCDVLYVSAGATRPLDAWLDALRPGGRLLFPLTPDEGLGGMLLVTRGNTADFAARFVSLAGFIPCEGARDGETALQLSRAFAAGKMWSVRSLRRNTPPDTSAWFAGDDWWLSTSGSERN